MERWKAKTLYIALESSRARQNRPQSGANRKQKAKDCMQIISASTLAAFGPCSGAACAQLSGSILTFWPLGLSRALPHFRLTLIASASLIQKTIGPSADTLQTAIAASVDLRCFATLTPRSDALVALESPNLEIDAEWSIAALPWSLVPAASSSSSSSSSSSAPYAPKELDATLLAALEKSAAEHVNGSGEALSKTAQGAAVAWLYLYMIVAGTKEDAYVLLLLHLSPIVCRSVSWAADR